MSIENEKHGRKSLIQNKMFEIHLKILTLGDSTVGKSSFINKFVRNTFEIDCTSNIGTDIQTRLIKMDGKTINVSFYDTAGQEKYRSISLSLMRHADGILLMYDITKQSSFDNISQWMESIYENKGNNFPLILIGNKCDLEKKRIITIEQGEKLGEKYGIEFMETSNKDGTNIDEASKALIKKILEVKKKEIKEITSTFVIMSDKDKEKIGEESNQFYKNQKQKNKSFSFC
jgi:small GTP-binding protein